MNDMDGNRSCIRDRRQCIQQRIVDQSRYGMKVHDVHPLTGDCHTETHEKSKTANPETARKGMKVE